MSTQKRRIARRVTVKTLNTSAAWGWMHGCGGTFRCALGRGGIGHGKREGDGVTPAGIHPLRRLWRRGTRTSAGPTGLPVRLTKARDGWCDSPGDPNYNRPVLLPYRGSAERMLRDDRLYDFVVEIGWNDGPRRAGRGSAIFLHVARPGYAPTEGCVAISAADFRRLLPWLGPRTQLVIAAGARRKQPSRRAHASRRA